MKDCKKCEYCEGIDYYDGTPNCTCEGGASSCPYNDSGDISKNEFKITLDIPAVLTTAAPQNLSTRRCVTSA